MGGVGYGVKRMGLYVVGLLFWMCEIVLLVFLGKF